MVLLCYFISSNNVGKISFVGAPNLLQWRVRQTDYGLKECQRRSGRRRPEKGMEVRS